MRALRLAAIWAPILGLALLGETMAWSGLVYGSLAFHPLRAFLAWAVSIAIGGFAGAPAAFVERVRERPDSTWRRDLVTALVATLVVAVACALYYLESEYTEAALAHDPTAGTVALAAEWRKMTVSAARYAHECWICGVPYGVTLFLRARRVPTRRLLVLVPVLSALPCAPSAYWLITGPVTPSTFSAGYFLIGETTLAILIPSTLALATWLDGFWLDGSRLDDSRDVSPGAPAPAEPAIP